MTKSNKPSKILIIDDNPEFIRSLKGLIMAVSGKLSEEIDSAQTGMEALQLLKDHPYQIAFMDIDLPDLDGITMTRFLDFENTNPDLKIIAISFHTEEQYRTRMLKAGAKAYLSKDEIDAEKLELLMADFYNSCLE